MFTRTDIKSINFSRLNKFVIQKKLLFRSISFDCQLYTSWMKTASLETWNWKTDRNYIILFVYAYAVNMKESQQFSPFKRIYLWHTHSTQYTSCKIGKQSRNREEERTVLIHLIFLWWLFLFILYKMNRKDHLTMSLLCKY